MISINQIEYIGRSKEIKVVKIIKKKKHTF